MSLRSILGDSNRIGKKSNTSRSTGSSSLSSSSWPANLPRRKISGAQSHGKQQMSPDEPTRDEQEDLLNHPLDDLGLVAALVTDLRLRDVAQAVKHARGNMFAPIPTRSMSSSLSMAITARRQAIPPVVSASHVQALLRATPTAVEREMAELVHAGVLRRVIVPTRGVVGDVLILAEEYEALVRRAPGLDDAAGAAFIDMLKLNPGVATVAAGPGLKLCTQSADALFRAGFLTSAATGRAGADGIFSRPEDRTTLLSVASVARAPSGTVAAVGGQGGAREHARGSAAVGTAGSSEYRIAVPGAGGFLRLVAAALQHFQGLLARLPHREAPEHFLKERWDGGTARGSGVQEAARLARGERVGTLPGRTRRWREFWGLQFEWVLAEAVGAGLVEVFETGSVGRGVRLLAR